MHTPIYVVRIECQDDHEPTALEIQSLLRFELDNDIDVGEITVEEIPGGYLTINRSFEEARTDAS